MLCDDVRRVVYFFLDGSLGQEKLLEFETHIRICRDCDERTTLSRKIRDFVRRRLTPVTAPEHLKIRVVQSLRVVHE
ncbi:MAG TPA: zf-HC2 domain-containing protein [Thermoanaerobaculia bacterium]|nr:zf-HC2 domain-containing protein [Thermoanaerobaculia bacterium]